MPRKPTKKTEDAPKEEFNPVEHERTSTEVGPITANSVTFRDYVHFNRSKKNYAMSEDVKAIDIVPEGRFVKLTDKDDMVVIVPFENITAIVLRGDGFRRRGGIVTDRVQKSSARVIDRTPAKYTGGPGRA